ncbi:helix-turn-helix transcriptional regulator [Chromobacterium piscinae]|uniref:AraC family transcriptional regulator n=1 Tax=Chromobacterium piscinae TaxID=686831 RepID=UPI001E51B6A1|nr:helix-turn-helix transcriptional regulator [Chromobacterium piscinae]MCD4506673.1 helix-turn-helix transcriptional regulator [Chromobacterium piscinae]
MESTPTPTNFSEWLEGPELIALNGGDEASREYRLGTREYDWHSHARAQLFCVSDGLIHVQTPRGSWLLPPHRAGYMPPDTPHRVRVSGALSGWSVFLLPSCSGPLPPQPCVLAITPLLHELVRRAASWRPDAPHQPEQRRIAAVILDEIRLAPREALHLPMPSDPRLQRIARAMLADPAASRSAEEWAALGALSGRNLRRLIQADTGMSFTRWRQQAQLVWAMEQLASGRTVAQVSDALDYASPSNFIAMFRRALGAPPAQYLSARGAAP